MGGARNARGVPGVGRWDGGEPDTRAGDARFEVEGEDASPAPGAAAGRMASPQAKHRASRGNS